VADGVDPEEFLKELSSFNEELIAGGPDAQPTPDPDGDPDRGRRRTEAAAVIANDGRRTVDRKRIAGTTGTAGAGAVGSAGARPKPAGPRSPEERKSLIGLIVAAVLTVLILSWIATSCLGDDSDSIATTDESTTITTAGTGTTSTTRATTTTTTTSAPTVDLAGEAATALEAAGISGVTATADGSNVVLSGSVADEASKAAAEAAVLAVDGVESVTNQIVVETSRDLNAEAAQALTGAGITGVTASVAGDVATLTGETAGGEQRLAAELAVLSISGIESVDNQITTPPTPAEILTTTLNDIVALNPIQFSTGSADIRDASKATLDEAIAVLAANPDGAVEVGGHTDSDGGADANRELSQERAQAVVDYLVTGGVAPARLTAVGYGEDSPLVPNSSGDNKKKNRRIEFKVTAAR
jgi:OOP family OmpA-OmpF porin